MHLYSLRSHSYGVKKAPDMNLKMFRRTLFSLNCVSIPQSLNLFNLLLWLMLMTNHPPFTVGRRYMYLTGCLAFGTALSQTMPHLTALQSFNPVQSNSHAKSRAMGRTSRGTCHKPTATHVCRRRRALPLHSPTTTTSSQPHRASTNTLPTDQTRHSRRG